MLWLAFALAAAVHFLLFGLAWTKVPVLRAALCAVMLPLLGFGCESSAMFLVFFVSAWFGISVGLLGVLLLLPGITIATLITRGDDLPWHGWIAPILSAVIYFPIFWLIFRWRAKRKTRRLATSEAAALGK